MASKSDTPDPATNPADKKPTPDPAKRQPSVTRSSLPYVVAAFVIAGVMAWYLFQFVPAKQEYFIGLRLRSIAVAASQIKSKAENLGLAFGARSAPNVAPASGAEKEAQELLDFADYLRVLVPQVRPDPYGRRPPGLRLTRQSTLPSGGAQKATVSWTDVTAQAAEISRDFDDLILAAANGEVVWQRESNTARVGNLTELWYADEERASRWPLSWALRPSIPKAGSKEPLPDTLGLRIVRLGNTSTVLIVQAVRLSPAYIEPAVPPSTDSAAKPQAVPGHTFYVAGVIAQSKLQAQAMLLPWAWVVTAVLPVLFLLFALPFMKLATLTSVERYSFADAVLLTLATIAAAGLAATVAFIRPAVNESGDRSLRQFAYEIDRGLRRDTDEVIKLQTEITAAESGLKDKLWPCRIVIERSSDDGDRRCDLWTALGRPPSSELDVVIWVDQEGKQAKKWTTKAQVTVPTPHQDFKHFRDVMTDDLWTLAPEKQLADACLPVDRAAALRFTIEPLRAPTTSEIGVLFAFVEAPKPGSPAKPHFLGLNVRPRSLLDAVVPPGYGFAVIEKGGRVLFHSDQNLALEENFFLEVSGAASIRAAADAGRDTTWSGDYHGRPHRLHIRPTRALAGCPWRIVSFQELERPLASEARIHSGTWRLIVVNLLVLFAVGAGFVAHASRRRLNVRDLPIFAATVSPRWLACMPALIVCAVLLLIGLQLPWAYDYLDGLYLFFAALPLFAVFVAIMARSTADTNPPAQMSSFERRLVAGELAFLVLLCAALPTAGFARIVSRIEDQRHMQQWLEEASERVEERSRAVRARAMGAAYRFAPPKQTIGQPSVRPREIVDRLTGPEGFAGAKILSNVDYLAAVPRVAVGDVPNSSAVSLHRPPRLEGFLAWNPFTGRRESGGSRVGWSHEPHQLQVLVMPGTTLIAGKDRLASAWSENRARLAIGFSIIAVIIGAVYWARRRLITVPPVQISTLADALQSLASDRSQGILLIGPPRTRKDQRIVDELFAVVQVKPLLRIRLLDLDITPEVIADALGEIDERAKKEGLDSTKRVWIHLSNLEAQLVDAQRRRSVLLLLERLLERAPNQPQRVLLVTTSVDPVAHFEEIFREERQGIYQDAIPEVELSRAPLLLSRFRRCFLPIKQAVSDAWWNYDPACWTDTLTWELSRYEPLRDLEREIRRMWKKTDPVPLDELARVVSARAEAVYQLLWMSCTRREKLVLIQLAQEGFVTHQAADVVAALTSKGLIVQRPAPAIFNYTFRGFLRRIERDAVVREWEKMEGSGLWVVAGRLVFSGLAAGALFFLVTQDYAIESVIPLVSTTGLFGIPLVRNVFTRMSSRIGGGGDTA